MEHNYEFNEKENVILSKLYKHMNFVGYSFLVLGALLAVIGINFLKSDNIWEILVAFVAAVILLTIGILTNNMASRFKAVVKTEGDDIDHLMVALDHLTSWFNIMIVFIGIAVGAAILMIIAEYF
jgi:sulfite exporter TauE/SafE